jgi:hypothetical protein
MVKANGKAKPEPKANGKLRGKLRQLKAEQQLMLRTIQARIFKHQAEAGEHTRLARAALDQAQAAALEYNQALQNFAKRLGVDLNATQWDNEKLLFVDKPAQPGAAEGQAAAQ